MPDVVQIVDSIASSPTVRLDLNDDTTWALDYTGTDFSPPPLKAAYASTLLADGELQVASAYANRRVRLRLDLRASSVDNVAAELQKLHRQMDRANFVKWQLSGMTNPVFFRTLRSGSNRITDYPGPGKLRTVEIDVEAEPFALGLLETVATANVGNHPAHPGNAGFFDISTVKGDVATPAILRVAASSFIAANDNQSLIAVRRRGTPSNTPSSLQAEAMTLGTDTTLPGNDAAMSGSSSNYARCSFATNATMVTRLSATHPASASLDNRGTYRVMARTRKSVSGDDIRMRLRWGGASAAITNDTITLASTTSIGYVDLGLIQLPPGPDPVTDGYSGVELSVNGVFLDVQAQRASGSGNLDVDFLWLIPADDRLCFVRWGTTSGGNFCVIDGTTERVFQTVTAGPVVNANFAQLTGGFPQLSPGVTNRIWFIRQTRLGASVDSVGNSYDVDASYYPRYLHVRPAST